MKNDQIWTINKSDVLYEDEFIIAINKPCGIPSQATLDPQRDHAYAAVGRYLKGGYVGLHHRLDAGTSGVLVLAKDQRANPSLSEQFQSHTIQKTYFAISFGTSPDERLLKFEHAFTIKAAIGEDKSSKIQKFSTLGKNRKHAETHIVTQAFAQVGDGYFGVFECQPLTGRTHQIRVHLESLGMPIVGDSLYSTHTLRSLRAWAPNRLCLHAQKIELLHPITNEPLTIEAPIPADLLKFAKKIHQVFDS